jgi:hypothetical protein
MRVAADTKQEGGARPWWVAGGRRNSTDAVGKPAWSPERGRTGCTKTTQPAWPVLEWSWVLRVPSLPGRMPRVPKRAPATRWRWQRLPPSFSWRLPVPLQVTPGRWRGASMALATSTCRLATRPARPRAGAHRATAPDSGLVRAAEVEPQRQAGGPRGQGRRPGADRADVGRRRQGRPRSADGRHAHAMG